MAKVKSVTGLPVFKIVNDEWYDHLHAKTLTDDNGVKYRSEGEFLADEDFYDGLNMVHVITNSEGEQFGFFFYDSMSDEGNIFEYNEEKFGLVGDYPEKGDYYGYYVYERVHSFAIMGYQRVE